MELEKPVIFKNATEQQAVGVRLQTTAILKAVATVLKADILPRLEAAEFRSKKAAGVVELGDRVKSLEARILKGDGEALAELRESFSQQFQVLQDRLIEVQRQLDSHKKHLQNLESKIKKGPLY